MPRQSFFYVPVRLTNPSKKGDDTRAHIPPKDRILLKTRPNIHPYTLQIIRRFIYHEKQ
jgi:hypothetical protein